MSLKRNVKGNAPHSYPLVLILFLDVKTVSSGFLRKKSTDRYDRFGDTFAPELYRIFWRRSETSPFRAEYLDAVAPSFFGLTIPAVDEIERLSIIASYFVGIDYVEERGLVCSNIDDRSLTNDGPAVLHS